MSTGRGNIHVLKACKVHKWRRAGKRWACTVCGRTTGTEPAKSKGQ